LLYEMVMKDVLVVDDEKTFLDGPWRFDNRKRLRDMGIAQYIEKPLELGEIVSEILSVGKERGSQ